VNIIIV